MSLFIWQVSGKIELVTGRGEHVLAHMAPGRVEFVFSQFESGQDSAIPSSLDPNISCRLYQVPDKPDSGSAYVSFENGRAIPGNREAVFDGAVRAVHFFKDEALRLLKRWPGGRVLAFHRRNDGSFSAANVYRHEVIRGGQEFHFLWEDGKRIAWPGERQEDHNRIVKLFLKAKEDELVGEIKETARDKLMTLIGSMSDAQAETVLSGLQGH